MSNQSVNHPCKVCGLSFSNRAKWTKRNQTVLYCSQRCRRNKPNIKVHQRQADLLKLLYQFKEPICLDELILKVGFPSTDQGRRQGKWAVHRLYHLGKVHLLKDGRLIHPDQNKGKVCVKSV